MTQLIPDIFYYVGILFTVFCLGIGLYLFWHFSIFGGTFDMERNKEKDVEINITLYNYNKHFKHESIR